MNETASTRSNASPLPAGARIGIIGGGQLGRMLAMAAARHGFHAVILDPEENCPAADVAGRLIVAAYDDQAAISELAQLCAVITYEFENVPVASARTADALKPVFPPPAALEIAQDRLVEKASLNAIGIATARYLSVESARQLHEGLKAFGGEGVLKTRRLGYDGKGQIVFRNAGDDLLPQQAIERLGAVPLILEERLDFAREVSIIAVRAQDGAIVHYDPAENTHDHGILRRSRVPALLAVDQSRACARAARDVLKALDYVGVIGIEFFVMDDGRLIANEFAPRVHNSGHWTEAACAVSQFDQHIRAIAGLPLGDPARHSDGVMVNLIGDEIDALGELCRQPATVIHVYGKSEIRKGRKMGHYTTLTPRSCG